MKLLLVEDHDLPQISFRATVRGGRLAEPAGQGRPRRAVRRGATHRRHRHDDRRPGRPAPRQARRRGRDRRRRGRRDRRRQGPDRDLRQGPAGVRRDPDEAPAFAQDKVDLGKTHMRSGISRRNDEVMGIAFREFQKLIYGATSPYARQFEYDDVERLTRDDLVAFHKTYYRPDATILAVWGDFDVADMKAKLGAAFAGLEGRGSRAGGRRRERSGADAVAQLHREEGRRADVHPRRPARPAPGRPGLPGRQRDERHPGRRLRLAHLRQGAHREGARLLRRRQACSPACDHVGAFYFFTSTKPSTTAEALATMLGEIKKIREAPVTDAELKRSKDGYLNSYAFEYDSTGKIVNRLADVRALRLPGRLQRQAARRASRRSPGTTSCASPGST